jgi:protein subunit release factor B
MLESSEHLVCNIRLEITKYIELSISTYGLSSLVVKPIYSYIFRKNWFKGCFKISEGETVTIDINEVNFQAISSSGPSGQNFNKVSSANRETHKKNAIAS